jgi:predicted glycoside hydrolase/deacetylase ChbG (UPF0249 family)
MAKYLIVNADDFGLSLGVNRGIIEAAEHGILTSATLMVRQPAAAEAASYARRNPKLSVGLRLDLGEWVYQQGEWVPLYSVVSTHDAGVVAGEVWRQISQFQRLLDRPPTHIDSHQHVHREEPVRSIVQNLAQRLGVPLREQTPGISYCGDFYGQDAESQTMPGALSVAALKNILASLPDGYTELGCHPGYDDGLATAYRTERAVEVQTLCSPEIPQALAELRIELRSFKSLACTTMGASKLLGFKMQRR